MSPTDGHGLPLYHIERMISEKGLPFGDGAHIIYVNGNTRDDSEIGRLMHDFSCANPDDMKYNVLAKRARLFKEEQRGNKNMSKKMEDLIDYLMYDEKVEAAEKLIAKDKMTLDDIAECLSLPIEKVRELAKQVQPQMA